jgi:hypothetical protein
VRTPVAEVLATASTAPLWFARGRVARWTRRVLGSIPARALGGPVAIYQDIWSEGGVPGMLAAFATQCSVAWLLVSIAAFVVGVWGERRVRGAVAP